jgi:phosphate/sulfate permease
MKFKNLSILILFFVLMLSVYGIASQDQPTVQDTKIQKIDSVWYNTPLAGVALASLFSLITMVVNSWTASHQDKKKWEREQKALYEKQKYDDQKNQIETIKNIYHNCIGRLSMIATIAEKDSEIEEENLSTLVKETIDWLAKLSIIQRDSYDPSENNYHKIYKDFVESPKFYADSLLKKVYSLAMQDKVLFPDKPLETKNENLIRAQIHYSEDYRRHKLVKEAIMLPYTTTFHFDLEDITTTQREKLWKQYGTNRKNIPSKILLSLPKLIEDKNKIIFKGETWWATNTNHKENTFIEIFKQWEIDFEKVLNKYEEKNSTGAH